jgi:hypothetical protein
LRFVGLRTFCLTDIAGMLASFPSSVIFVAFLVLAARNLALSRLAPRLP